MKVRYVVGFAFDPALQHVLLVLKNRPSWQAGKFNGPGGKIEEDEEPKHAMVREFKEETGLDTLEHAWKEVKIEGDENYELHVFSTFMFLDDLKLAESFVSDEPATCFPLDYDMIEKQGVNGLVDMIFEAMIIEK